MTALPGNPIRLEIIARPRPKGRHRTNPRSGHSYTPARTVQAESAIYSQAFAQLLKMGFRRFPIFKTGPVGLSIVFHMPIKDAKLWGTDHWKTPDRDNLEKLLLDALSGNRRKRLQPLLWANDAQNSWCMSKKVYAAVGYTEIEVFSRIPSKDQP